MKALRTLLILSNILLSPSCVWASGPAGKPNLTPLTCVHLEPKLCQIAHSINPYMFYPDSRYYWELCPNHVCMELANDQNVSVSFKHAETHSYVNQNHYDHFSQSKFTKPLSRGNTSLEKFLNPKLFRVDSEGRFTRTSGFWFCGPDVVDYRARVSEKTNVGYGQKEDMFAHCEWLRMESFMRLSNCEGTTYPCEECLASYRYFLCAMYFPKCEESNRGGPFLPNSYAFNFVPANEIKTQYLMTRPCRALCWDVIVKCNLFIGLTCHRYDSREYGDPPDCNAVHNLDALSMRM